MSYSRIVKYNDGSEQGVWRQDFVTRPPEPTIIEVSWQKYQPAASGALRRRGSVTVSAQRLQEPVVGAASCGLGDTWSLEAGLEVAWQRLVDKCVKREAARSAPWETITRTAALEQRAQEVKRAIWAELFGIDLGGVQEDPWKRLQRETLVGIDNILAYNNLKFYERAVKPRAENVATLVQDSRAKRTQEVLETLGLQPPKALEIRPLENTGYYVCVPKADWPEKTYFREKPAGIYVSCPDYFDSVESAIDAVLKVYPKVNLTVEEPKDIIERHLAKAKVVAWADGGEITRAKIEKHLDKYEVIDFRKPLVTDTWLGSWARELYTGADEVAELLEPAERYIVRAKVPQEWQPTAAQAKAIYETYGKTFGDLKTEAQNRHYRLVGFDKVTDTEFLGKTRPGAWKFAVMGLKDAWIPGDSPRLLVTKL
jgi:hypothetical protein